MSTTNEERQVEAIAAQNALTQAVATWQSGIAAERAQALADFEAWRSTMSPKRAILPATTDWCTLFSYSTNTQVCLLSNHNSHPVIYQIVCSAHPGSVEVVQPAVTSTGYNYTPSALTFRRLDVNGAPTIQAQSVLAYSKVALILNYQQVREHITLLTEHIAWT